MSVSVKNRASLRVLYIPLEFKTWQNASHLPYSGNYGFEEGFTANGMEYLTIPAFYETTSSEQISWLNHARELCAGKNFDHVWLEIVHSRFDESFLDWIATIAPVRIGFVWESCEMHPDEIVNNPEGVKRRQANLERNFKFVTHVVAIDEKDVENFNTHNLVKTKWLWDAGIMPERFICKELPSTPAPNNCAVFYGSLYGERKKWLEHSALKGLLVRPVASPEYSTNLPGLFDKLNATSDAFLKEEQASTEEFFSTYIDSLRVIRRECFALWLSGLSMGVAIVNLPQFGKGYASRVLEGMAAGRPVISYEIPDRPRTKALFEDGKEILLYKGDDPYQLAEHIQRILREPDFARRISANARSKIMSFHTTERLVSQILDWVENREINSSLMAHPLQGNQTQPGNKMLLTRNFYGPGDIVFDVGANVGDKTHMFLESGAKVICFEPQSDCTTILQKKYGNDKRVVIVEKGLADKNGKRLLSVCSQANTISTFSDDWKRGRFADYTWDKSDVVEVITLDDAIHTYGFPQYVKIDVEGFEYQVLCGLSKPVPYLSFEFTIEFLDRAKQCMSHLERLGYEFFNFSEKEIPQLVLSEWVSSKTLFKKLERLTDQLYWGDIYAKYDTLSPNNKKNFTHEIKHILPDKSAVAADIRNTISTVNTNILKQLYITGLWGDNQPLRLHLGCGEQRLDGYVNIDYPPSEHNVMQVKADVYANIMELDFPAGSVDEIRSHHVFEHFNRVTALAMLIKWYHWLKVGGKLHIETPDLVGSAKTLLGDYSWKTKMGAVRHIAGDQSSGWSYHIDHWFPERFEHTLNNLGFRPVQTQSTSWPHDPFLSNVTAIAVKSHNVSLSEQVKAADELLWESTVASTEQPTYEVWKQQLRSLLSDKSEMASQVPLGSQLEQVAHVFQQSKSEQSIQEIHDFNQRERDRWVQLKAVTVPAGSRVLDIGAGTCPYRALFAHGDYKTHDFKRYTGEKLGGTTEYGKIDYESDICAIPVPDNSFDVIVCTEVLEHTPEPIEALREMSRILKEGGRLFLTAPLGSGLHQLPYHYYGGFTPEWYKHFCSKFGLYVSEISPNGGFFKLLAQECARVAWTLPQHQHLHGNNVELIKNLFGEWIPRYLFELEKKHGIDQFTVGYHVEAVKVRDIDTVQKLIENDLQNVNLYLEAARSLLNQGEYLPARRYVEDALELNHSNTTLIEMHQQLVNKP